MTGLEQGCVEFDGKFIKQPKARIRPEPFKSFRFAKEGMPELRKLGPDPLCDTEPAAPPAFLAA